MRTTNKPFGHSIIVVDDEDLIRWSLAEPVRGEGHTVHEARDGVECLERFDEVGPA